MAWRSAQSQLAGFDRMSGRLASWAGSRISREQWSAREMIEGEGTYDLVGKLSAALLLSFTLSSCGRYAVTEVCGWTLALLAPLVAPHIRHFTTCVPALRLTESFEHLASKVKSTHSNIISWPSPRCWGLMYLPFGSSISLISNDVCRVDTLQPDGRGGVVILDLNGSRDKL